jgi:hypothetical protein
MDCVEIEAWLSAFLDDELDDAQTADVERHLNVCDSCRRKRAVLAAVRDAIQQLPTETVSAGFAATFQQRLEGESRARRVAAHRPSSSRRPVALALAAAAVLVLLVWATAQRRSPVPAASPAPGAALMTPEAWPGLDCGLDLREPRPEEQPCASPDSCGGTGVRPEMLTPSARRRLICVGVVERRTTAGLCFGARRPIPASQIGVGPRG